MGILLGAVVVILALGFVMLPLLRRRAPGRLEVTDPPSPADDPRVAGPADRREIYRQILDLDLDHRVGKLDDADYRELSEACLARAASLLAEEERDTAAADERVEREIAAMRQALRSSTVPATPERKVG
jgi:hypothetical protein